MKKVLVLASVVCALALVACESKTASTETVDSAKVETTVDTTAAAPVDTTAAAPADTTVKK